MNLPVEPVRKAARDWTVPVLILVVVGTLVMCISVVILGSQVGKLDESIAADQDNRDLVECRTEFTSAVSEAQTDYLISFGVALTAFARGEETEPLLDAVEAASVALEDAQQSRQTFELAPTGTC